MFLELNVHLYRMQCNILNCATYYKAHICKRIHATTFCLFFTERGITYTELTVTHRLGSRGSRGLHPAAGRRSVGDRLPSDGRPASCRCLPPRLGHVAGGSHDPRQRRPSPRHDRADGRQSVRLALLLLGHLCHGTSCLYLYYTGGTQFTNTNLPFSKIHCRTLSNMLSARFVASEGRC